MKINCKISIFQYYILPFFLLLLLLTVVSAQNFQEIKQNDYLKLRWKQVATQMPEEWYGTEDAKRVAENLLICQKEIGGWVKNRPYHHILSKSEKRENLKSKTEIGGTFDNGSTITELRFLARTYSYFLDERYKKAFEKGIDYIFISQYENGGWPQFFPARTAKEEFHVDKTTPYSSHITYNDDAMVNILRFLQDIFSNNKEFDSLQLSEEIKNKARIVFQKGIECILKTQIRIDGKPTVWCAQHDEKTFAPAKARAYELESFSGSESVGIVKLLMSIYNPSDEIIASVEYAVEWFEQHKIEGIALVDTINAKGEKDIIVIEDKKASPLWGRFYDLETGKPFFCSRDGIKRGSLAEISYERREGYGWYTDAPTELLKTYPEWKRKIVLKKEEN
jgi:PelA/Pel-15E family pectate lyase